MRLSRLSPGFIGPICIAGWIAVVSASPALAQSPESSLVLPGEIEVRGRGWGQLSDLTEMVNFALTLIETAVLTALLAFHPVNLGKNDQTAVIDLRKGMFLFALIGMLTGFLVLHHGYLIGFVIFGIGGLFRFRMESSSIPDTGQLVVVSLIGLAAGLDLPVMALVASVAAWIVIFLFGRTQRLGLEVKFDSESAPQDAIMRLQKHLVESGFSVASVAKPKFKQTAQYVLASKLANAQTALVREMTELQERENSGILDWHID